MDNKITNNPFHFLSEKKEKTIQIRIGQGLLEWVDGYAEQAGTTRSALILQSIVEFASRVEAVREANLQIDINVLLSEIANCMKIVPDDKGGYRMEKVEASIVELK